MTKLKEPKTHFEQVPLKIVKKIAVIEAPDDEANGLGATLHPSGKK
jgi:hypothetical protein